MRRRFRFQMKFGHCRWLGLGRNVQFAGGASAAEALKGVRPASGLKTRLSGPGSSACWDSAAATDGALANSGSSAASTGSPGNRRTQRLLIAGREVFLKRIGNICRRRVIGGENHFRTPHSDQAAHGGGQLGGGKRLHNDRIGADVFAIFRAVRLQLSNRQDDRKCRPWRLWRADVRRSPAPCIRA